MAAREINALLEAPDSSPLSPGEGEDGSLAGPGVGVGQRLEEGPRLQARTWRSLRPGGCSAVTQVWLATPPWTAGAILGCWTVLVGTASQGSVPATLQRT